MIIIVLLSVLLKLKALGAIGMCLLRGQIHDFVQGFTRQNPKRKCKIRVDVNELLINQTFSYNVEDKWKIEQKTPIRANQTNKKTE